MSMLSAQSDKLRSWADQLSEREEEFGVVVRALVADLREAAGTVESLRDSLNEVADKWAEAQIKAEDYARENMLLKRDNDTRWHELFGTPERAARTMVDMCEGGTFDDCGGCPAALAECKLGDYDALLEWLKGGTE